MKSKSLLNSFSYPNPCFYPSIGITEAQDRRLLPLTLISENPTMELNAHLIFDGTSKAIDLSKLNVELRKLISLILLYYLYNNPTPCILVLEEAQNIVVPRRVEQSPSIAEMMIAEMRRFNIGIILIAHNPNDLPSSIINDAYAIISLSKKSMPFRVEDEKLAKKNKLLFYENGAKVKALR
jgi:DNA helicase HerA-like ATPase